MSRIITVPADVRDGSLTVVASVSGGKDSTALILALREADVPARYVFADTQWEAPETYQYLDTLRERLGIVIDVVGVEGGMRGEVDRQHRFPSRLQRWCTRKLKLEPLRAYHDAIEATGAETVCAMGIRADESTARAAMPEWEDDAEWGGYLWRPLIAWTIPDVIAIHHRHGVPMNPLYLRGHNRVGCYPCIYAAKDEIRLTAEHASVRIDDIARMESECTDYRRRAEPGRFRGGDDAHYFGTVPPMGIRQVVEWSRTTRGGKQLPLFAPAPTGGCMRWGLCEHEPEDTNGK